MIDSLPIHFAFEMNTALDSGKYDDIGIDEVLRHIEAVDVIEWLRQRLGNDVDLSLFDEPTTVEWQSKLLDHHLGYGNQSRRKYGVEHRGLCLLVAIAISIERAKRK